mmetsp:Transcript_38874/g.66353  ORF Transcript_38874/g.66353 Transcript_38874/m.66353 type:complete len:559 (-) Transcript_38874:131-1807(-)
MATIPFAWSGVARSMSAGAVRRLTRSRNSSASGVCTGPSCHDPTTPAPCVRRRRLSTAPTAMRPFVYRPRRSTQQAFHAFSTAISDEDADADDLNDNDDGLDMLPNLSVSMIRRIRATKARHDEIMKQLHDGGDQTALGKELSSLSGISTLCEKASDIYASRVTLLELQSELLNEEGQEGSEENNEMMEEIKEELAQLEVQIGPLSQKLIKSLIPQLNPDDLDDLTTSDAVIDIRAGTGGDEACLFASEILAGYEAIAKSGGADETGTSGKSWDVEMLSVSRTDLGGVKEASLVVSSRSGGGGGYSGYGGYDDADDADPDQDDATIANNRLIAQLGPYGFFQYESGVHRVQRVPINDVKMQTSAVSVAVLPSLAENSSTSFTIPPTELKIDTMRASGAGGQHVNTTESAVRVTHIPTGIVAYMQEERSQHKNKAKALKLVTARVHQYNKERDLKDRSSARSSLMGGGDRSERIRTYNFPQDRITDHRCKVSVSGVKSWLGGGTMVRKFGPSLYEMEREERVVAMEEEEEEEEERRRRRGNGGGGGNGVRGKGKSGRKR